MKEPLIKLCGNRSYADLVKSASSNATHLGFIFVKKTKRYVRPEQVGKWVRESRPKQKLVGVFVNPTMEEVEEVLHFVPLDVIQLHGDELVSDLLKIREACRLPIWKAIRHQANGVEQLELYRGVANGYVVDSKVKGAYGGTGVSFDWAAISSYQKEARGQNVPIFIAGGIKPDNISELLHHHPDGIDVSSGIETDEQKDLAKIQKIMKEVEQHAASFS